MVKNIAVSVLFALGVIGVAKAELLRGQCTSYRGLGQATAVRVLHPDAMPMASVLERGQRSLLSRLAPLRAEYTLHLEHLSRATGRTQSADPIGFIQFVERALRNPALTRVARAETAQALTILTRPMLDLNDMAAAMQRFSGDSFEHFVTSLESSLCGLDEADRAEAIRCFSRGLPNWVKVSLPGRWSRGQFNPAPSDLPTLLNTIRSNPLLNQNPEFAAQRNRALDVFERGMAGNSQNCRSGGGGRDGEARASERTGYAVSRPAVGGYEVFPELGIGRPVSGEVESVPLATTAPGAGSVAASVALGQAVRVLIPGGSVLAPMLRPALR